MTTLFLRVLPLLTSLLVGTGFWAQRHWPLSYPYLIFLPLALFGTSVILLAWQRVPWHSLLEKILPTGLLLLALAFGLLFAEDTTAVGVIIALATFASFAALELLYDLAHFPAAYPVNGLSRLSIAFVPIAVWYAVSTSVAFLFFLHTPGAWHIGLTIALGMIFFRTTGHPEATPAQNRRWLSIGGLVGFQVGWLNLLLPLSIAMHGFIAALIFTLALRMRRYNYAPTPSPRQAIFEFAGGFLALIVAMATAKWL